MAFRRADRVFALSFGGVILLLMVTITALASFLHDHLQKKEESRFANVLGQITRETISRISFSGKYQSRLLVEELTSRIPDMVFISVETTNGLIIAHSNPKYNDTVITNREQLESSRECLDKGRVIRQYKNQGQTILEVLAPYQSRFNNEVMGVVRLGIDVDTVRHERQQKIILLVVLSALLTLFGMVVVFLMSRHFGKQVRSLATQLIRDITERKRAEQALRESEEKLSKMIAAAQDAIIMLDDHGKIELWNDAAVRIFGYSTSEAIGQDLHELLASSKFLEEFRMGFTKFQKNGSGSAVGRIIELKGLRKNREEFPIELSLAGVELNNRWHAIGIVRDISERKHAEEDRERLQAQLIQSQKMESVGRLAGGVAHDFNNMLQTILGNVEMALEEIKPDKEPYESLIEIQNAAQRSANLTRQLLAFARKQTVTPTIIDLNETVSGMLKMLQRLISENIQLIWRPGHNLWPLLIDPAQIDQILANLTINARDAIHSGGTVTIQTSNQCLNGGTDHQGEPITPGEYVLLSVSDNGCGMKKEVLDHLFEPFFTTKDVGKGTGLGLATVFGIVSQNNGYLQVLSAPNKGATFKILLPRAERDPDEDAPETVHCSLRGTETILLVEDEERILRLGRNILTQYGYQVLATQSPSEAVSMVSQHHGRIDMLITDVIMPQMNGRELQERIEAMHPGILTLYISGYTADVIAPHGVLAADIHFLEKPFSIRTLTAKVRELFDHSKRQIQ